MPAWGGEQAGQPGAAYAKVLRDVVTGEAPVVSYWKQSLIDSDNRIAAGETARTAYTFLLPPGAAQVQVTAELRFRRLFAETAVAKGWNTTDVLMSRMEVAAGVGPKWVCYAPVVIGGSGTGAPAPAAGSSTVVNRAGSASPIFPVAWRSVWTSAAAGRRLLTNSLPSITSPHASHHRITWVGERFVDGTIGETKKED